MTIPDVAEGPGWKLICGDYREVLADVTCDALITDPPYSERTEKGQRSGTVGCADGPRSGSIGYGFVTPEWWTEHATSWAPRIRRWFVGFGDHASAQWAIEAYAAAGFYDFPPVIWAKTDAAPRLMADGPSPQHETIAVARPRRRLARAENRHRPGWYLGGCREGKGILVGGKPPWLMRALVRDYSEPGDLVCDPCAGGATTLLASVIEGRRAIGAERDPETWRKAVARLRRGYTPSMF